MLTTAQPGQYLFVVTEEGSNTEDASPGPDASIDGSGGAAKTEALAERGGRMFALAGVLWTTTFALGFIWEMSAAIGGREVFVRRFQTGGSTRVLLELLVVGAAGLTWVGLALALRSDAPSLRGHRRLQWTAGALALGFAFAHAWRFWLPASFGADAGTVYELLRRSSPYYGSVAFYVVGLASLALAWEQNLVVLAGTWHFVRREQTMRWYRLATIVVPVAMFVVGVNAVGHFVTGRGLFWRPAFERSEEHLSAGAEHSGGGVEATGVTSANPSRDAAGPTATGAP